MYRVRVSCGNSYAMTVKSMTFADKASAVVFITEQLNKILNNPKVTKWDIQMN